MKKIPNILGWTLTTVLSLVLVLGFPEVWGLYLGLTFALCAVFLVRFSRLSKDIIHVVEAGDFEKSKMQGILRRSKNIQLLCGFIAWFMALTAFSLFMLLWGKASAGSFN